MKKFLKIIILQFIIVFFAVNAVQAVDNPCKISLSTSKTTLKPGDQITVNILISDIILPEGVNNITAILDYDKDVFDIIYDETDEAEEELANYSGLLDENSDVAMFYVGGNDTSSTKSQWNGLLYKDRSGAEGIMLYTNEEQKTSQTIAKMTLKVKENAPKTNTKISFQSLVAYDQDNKNNNINDTSISFTIDGTEIIGSQPPYQNENNQNNNNANNNNQNENLGNDISEKENPNTGIEDYVPAFLVIIAIAMFSYINYRKYKDI